MSRTFTRFAALAPAVALLAVASPASAASTISIPSTLNLTSKVLVNVPVTYQCPLFTGLLFPDSFGNVSVQQASSQAFTACDGLAVSVSSVDQR
jgi:hypothetical protein